MTARSKRLKRKSKVRRKRDPIPWKYCILTMICGLILVAGFFYAARQHFSSMSYGMENAKLRKEIEKLKSSERLYKLKREIALTPSEIKKAARKLGLQSMSARNIEVVQSRKPSGKSIQSKKEKPEKTTSNSTARNSDKSVKKNDRK